MLSVVKCEGLLDDASPYQRDLLERRLSDNADFVACVGLTAFLLDTVRNRHAGTVAAIDDGMNGTGVLDAEQVKVKQQAAGTPNGRNGRPAITGPISEGRACPRRWRLIEPATTDSLRRIVRTRTNGGAYGASKTAGNLLRSAGRSTRRARRGKGWHAVSPWLPLQNDGNWFPRIICRSFRWASSSAMTACIPSSTGVCDAKGATLCFLAGTERLSHEKQLPWR